MVRTSVSQSFEKRPSQLHRHKNLTIAQVYHGGGSSTLTSVSSVSSEGGARIWMALIQKYYWPAERAFTKVFNQGIRIQNAKNIFSYDTSHISSEYVRLNGNHSASHVGNVGGNLI